MRGVVADAIRKELVTLDELQSKLREQGVDDLGSVKLVQMESDGQLSVVGGDEKRHRGPSRPFP